MWAAGRYEAVGTRIAHIAGQLVDVVNEQRPLANTTVVDLACGTGSAALAAARHGARVVAVDVTPELLAIGAEKAAAAGLPIEFVEADAADTSLDSASCDAVVSNMGLIFVDPDAQVREVARILKRGGVLGFSAWRRAGVNPFFDPIAAVLGREANSGFSPDQWGDDAVATSRLAANFGDIGIEHRAHTWTFESLDAAMHFVTSESPMHVNTFHAAGSRRDALAAAFEDALAAHLAADGQVAFDSPYSIVTAIRR